MFRVINLNLNCCPASTYRMLPLNRPACFNSCKPVKLQNQRKINRYKHIYINTYIKDIDGNVCLKWQRAVIYLINKVQRKSIFLACKPRLHTFRKKLINSLFFSK